MHATTNLTTGQRKLLVAPHLKAVFIESTGLFESATERDGGLWPSRIRVYYGVENTAVCDAMVEVNGEGRGSFIDELLKRNQRMEWL